MHPNHRALIATAVGALALVASQARAEPPAQNHPANNAPPAPTAAPSPPLSQPEAWTLAEALNAGEVKEAQAALTKAHSPAVKDFAQHMLQAHRDADKTERDVAARLRIAHTRSPALDAMEAEQRDSAQKLQSASAKDFDRVYMDAQVKGHEDALATIDGKILPSLTDPQLRANVEALRAIVAEHLDEAKRVQAGLAPPQSP